MKVKIYADDNGEILSIGTAPEEYAGEFEVQDSFLNDQNYFYYKVRMGYMMNEDFEFVLDEDGNKIETGPIIELAVDVHVMHTMETIQKQNAAMFEEQLDSIVENDYRLSMMELGL